MRSYRSRDGNGESACPPQKGRLLSLVLRNTTKPNNEPHPIRTLWMRSYRARDGIRESVGDESASAAAAVLLPFIWQSGRVVLVVAACCTIVSSGQT
jgi:hypothetical protein